MKYTSEIIVNVPLKEFIKKFDNVDNRKHWQRGLVSVAHISGEPGVVGAKMKLTYMLDKRKLEVIETITYQKFPHEFHITYSMDGIDNIQENYFEDNGNDNTKWKSVSEFMPLSFKMRAMLWFMPNAFKKQSMQYMIDFKNFAEKGQPVVHEKA